MKQKISTFVFRVFALALLLSLLSCNQERFMSGIVTVIANETYDFSNNTSTPAAVVSTAWFTKQTTNPNLSNDPFADLREKCFSVTASNNLAEELKLPTVLGTPIEAGTNIALNKTDNSLYASLDRVGVGSYKLNSNITTALPSSLSITVPGASGGFPSSNDSVGIAAQISTQGFKVAEPPLGTQADLNADIHRGWTAGPTPATGSTSVIIMQMFGVQNRAARALCYANDDGGFDFLKTNAAYQALINAGNNKVRFESSARAVGRIKQIDANTSLTTILVDRSAAQ